MNIPEHIIESKNLYEGRVVKFRLDKVSLPDGSTTIREIVSIPKAVVIVPLTKDNEVRMVRQYRSGIKDFLLELPAGEMEANETPEQSARRELQEETGDTALVWKQLPGFYSTPGICDEFLYLFLAKDLKPGKTHYDKDEFIESVTIPMSKVLNMIKTGEIKDSKTIAGILTADLLTRS